MKRTVNFLYLFRLAVSKYGMFDQVRVDHGKEFYLVLGMQEQHKDLRRSQTKLPFTQTQSKKVLQ